MKFPLVICAVAYAAALNSQTLRAYEHAATNAMEARNYYAAMQYYEKVLEMEPSRLDASYRYADAARQFGAFGKAEAYYERTLKADEKGNYPETSFKLADVKKQLGKYDEAIDLYQKFTTTSKVDKSLRDLAAKDLEQCEWAMEKLTTPDRSVILARLADDVVNTSESEFGATERNGKLYFSSFRNLEWGDRNYPERPIIKVMESENGDDPTPASFNDKKRHTAHTAFSPDGNFLIFNKCDYRGDSDIPCQLYFTMKNPDGTWTEAVQLPDNINREGYTATQPNIRATEDGYYELYYTSDCPGGKGGLDLWKVRFSAVGNFGKPENIAALNTPENDITPVFDSRRNLLFFSTTGRWSLGGYDIYRAALQNGQWQEPAHMDVPFNSNGDDLYFAPQDGDYAYLTSNRTGSATLENGACCFDVYKVEYLPLSLEALAFSKPRQLPLNDVLFTLTEVPTDDAPTSRFSADKNNADFDLKRERKYRVIAQKEFYRPDTAFVTTTTFPENRHFVERLHLVPEIALAVKTFHQWTKDPLNGVQIRLYELPGMGIEEQNTGDTDNESQIFVGDKRFFTIIAEKQDFVSDTTVVTEAELRAIMAGSTLTKNLFLSPATMSAYLPITLYFDNDQPDPRTRATTTASTYEETVARYMARREAFIEAYSANLQGEEKSRAVEQLGNFFDNDVQGGQLKLESFTGNLQLFLDGGANIEIMVKAFASPLAKAEYNMALTQRRIASVKNYFRKYRNGIFESHVRTGRLKISILPLGETVAPTNVSDDALNKRLSIFSPEASRERRAEIIEVRLFKN